MKFNFNDKAHTKYSAKQRQILIKEIKDTFERKLAMQLKLLRVSAPIIVEKETGLNDDLCGSRKVEFDAAGAPDKTLQVVQSLAKWKRYALKKYGFTAGEGLYTDMIAIRRDEDLDALHSLYVDQWDWEKVITDKQRTLDFLYKTVRKIIRAVTQTASAVSKKTGAHLVTPYPEIFFITSKELEKLYPNLSAERREYEIVKTHKTVFLSQISQQRASDYDDWTLNGDILFYHEVLDCVLELSSGGIRVNSESLRHQLQQSNEVHKLKFDYHAQVMSGELPLTIGGGIGQSRLCMLLLGSAHIGEVQASFWPQCELDWCKKNDIDLL